MAKFQDPRLLVLNEESAFANDGGMRDALQAALENDEVAVAAYAVSAHIWVSAVLTDRALLIVKGAVRARVLRVPFPVEVLRGPSEVKRGARVGTPLGDKTLWSSKLDPEMKLLLRHGASTQQVQGTTSAPIPSSSSQGDSVPIAVQAVDRHAERKKLAWPQRSEARRRAGKKPKKPRRQTARAARVGFAPVATIWDTSYNCVKCGRALTNPESQRHRVGTECIKVYGSQGRRIVNPAHTAWSERRTQADVERIAQQAAYDAEYEQLRAAYETALSTWREIRAGKL